MNTHVFYCRTCQSVFSCTCDHPAYREKWGRVHECDRCFEKRKREAIQRLLDWAKSRHIDLRPASERLP